MNTINDRSQADNDVIQYGLELLLDSLLKFLFIQSMGIVFGMGKETLIVLISFCGLRLQAGGKHAKTGLGCSLAMVMIWLVSILCGRFFKIGMVALICVYCVCTVIIICCAPRTINIEYFTPLAKKKKKLYSCIFLTLLMLIAAVFPMIRGFVVFPVILEVATLLPKNKNKKENEKHEERKRYETAGKVNETFS